MNILVFGGTGQTGRLVIEELLDKDYEVTTIIRKTSTLPSSLKSNTKLTQITGTILEMSDSKLKELISNCDVVISCLGHNLTCTGMFGQPRSLVTDTLKKVSNTIDNYFHQKQIKLILMNSIGVSNLDLDEKTYFSQKCITFLLRKLLPPHLDNEKAADFLRIELAQKKNIQWVSVRPSSLIDETVVTPYNVFSFPIDNPIIGKGKVSRKNVANFMVNLISNDSMWDKWKGQMPVIYNQV